MNRSVFRRAALGALVLAVVAAPLEATGAQLSDVDGRGDFWHDPRPDGEPYQSELDGGEEPDIRRVVYTHGSEEVRARVRLEDLNRWGYWLWDLRIRTNEDLRRRVTLFRDDSGGMRGAVEWSGSKPCAVTYRIDLADDAVVLRVPRRCLSGPEEVSFRFRSRYWPTSDDWPWVDVAGTDGYDFAGWTAPVD